tara:strand:+ start:103 stop:291 length:189 start_codon:yes stop_codon:yes gene_type:complete
MANAGVCRVMQKINTKIYRNIIGSISVLESYYEVYVTTLRQNYEIQAILIFSLQAKINTNKK